MTSIQKVKFWLHRTLSEKTQDLKKLSKDISVLNHQAENFEVMSSEIQEEVIQSLKNMMLAYGWENEIGDLE